MVAFAKSEYSEENLLFFEAVKVYRRTFLRRGQAVLTDVDEQAMRARASEIIDTFLRLGAPSALNLPANLLADFRSGVPPAGVSAQSFDACVRVIFRAIEQDTFQRFQGTDLANTATELLGGSRNRRRSSSESIQSQESLVSMAAKDGAPFGAVVA